MRGGRKDKMSEKKLIKPVYLIGFMGAGKSSVGRRLSRKYGFEVVDADAYLERQEGRSISQIFAEDGEEAFRLLETKYLEELSLQPRIICTGGGVVKREENCKIMKRYGFAIYLHVTADAAAARISDLNTRPLFKDLKSARKLIEERIPLYEHAADARIDTINRDLAYICRDVLWLLETNQLLVDYS